MAGAICGVTGIAGGMVLGPLFLQYNMVPQVMSSTNQYIGMIMSISTMLQFAVEGKLDAVYEAIFGMLGLLATYGGLTILNRVLKRTGKQSPIVIMLVVVMCVSLAMMPLKLMKTGLD